MTVKTTRTLVVLGACALVLSVGCRKKEAPEAEGKELSKNPIAAFGQIQEAVKKAEQAAKESQDMKAGRAGPLLEAHRAPPEGPRRAGRPTVSRAARRRTPWASRSRWPSRASRRRGRASA